MSNAANQKWAFILYNVGIFGGVNVIFEHAIYAINQGVEITIVSQNKINSMDAGWHPGTEKILYKTFEDCAEEEFDVVIATSWETAFGAFKIKAKKYLYFVQAIESQFYEKRGDIKSLAELTYTMPFQIITEATWIKEYLYDMYGHSAKLVLNGIRKDLYFGDNVAYKNRESGKLRVLVEGSLSDWRKNIPFTIEACRRSEADEIWLLTSSPVQKYEGVDRVFSQIPVNEVPRIYRSCDVLVKLSLVEGMFGPPLEMFHCGGTAITYAIPGSEEYIVHGKNALIADKGAMEQIVQYINQLKKDSSLLESLKNGAIETARNWRGWDVSSREFFDTVNAMPLSTKQEKEIIKLSSEIYYDLLYKKLPMIGSIQSVEKIDKIDKNLKENNLMLLIYGAGQVAKGIIHQLDEYGIKVAGIAVSELEGNPCSVLGHAVSLIDDFQSFQHKYLVYIATNKYHDEIEAKLKELGFEYII